jgi:hypothetical protein
MQLNAHPDRLPWCGFLAKLALLLALMLVCGSAVAQGIPDLPRALQEKVEAAEALCTATDNGSFALDRAVVDRVDLDGDGRSDWILNEVGFSCSTAVSLFCGTGGCLSHFLVSDSVQSLLNQGWTVTASANGPVVLARLNSAACGGGVGSACFAASIWDAESGAWRSASAQWEVHLP